MENKDQEAKLFLEYLFNEYSSCITNIIHFVDPIIEDFTNINNGVMSSLNKFQGPVLQLFNHLKLSYEKKDEFRTASEQWGKMGWTYPPSAGISLFYTVPDDPNKVEEMASGWSRTEDMEELFSLLLKEDGVNRDDIEESIFLFNNEKYKSCALILFSLIDAVFINCQSIELNKNGNIKKRKIGYFGAKDVLGKIDEEFHFENLPIVLSYFNIIKKKKKFFESGEDFRIQPDVLNRNFVAHGMFARKAERKDCVQVFLLYYNILRFLNTFRVEDTIFPIDAPCTPSLHLVPDKESGHAR